MLEALDLQRSLSKEDYKRELPGLRSRLHQLQRACFDAKVSALVVLDGWDAVGLGTLVNKLTERLEPRAFTLHTIRPPRTTQQSLPWMARFWARLPNWGEMAIYAPSWYRQLMSGRAENGLGSEDWLRACRDVRSFELALADDRYLLSKFFFHIDRDEQKRRFDELRSDPFTAWRVGEEELRRHRRWERHRVAIEETLEATETEWGPWTLVASSDRHWMRRRVFTTLIRRIEEGLERFGVSLPDYESPEEMARANDEDLDG